MRRKYYLLKYLIVGLAWACVCPGISTAAVRSSSSKSPAKTSDAATGINNAAAKTSGPGYKTLTTVKYQGKSYFVVLYVQQNSCNVWLRSRPDMSSKDDMKIMEVTVKNFSSLDAAAKTICSVKSTYDKGKTLVGCGASVGAGICVAGTGPGSAVMCQALISYTTSKGLADCIDGVGGAIANYLGRGEEWDKVRMIGKISTGQFAEAIDKAIDVACTEVQKQ